MTVCEPHNEEKATLPLVFLTVIVNDAELEPETVADPGATWIWPLLLEVAVIVPLPLKLISCTLTVAEPFSDIVSELALADSEQGVGGGVGEVPGVGDVDGVGDGLPVGSGVGD